MKWRKLDFFLLIYKIRSVRNSLSKIIRGNMYTLNMNEEVRKTFSPGSMVSFWNARKLSSYLVWAKLYPLQRKIGSSKCGKRRCEVCNNITDISIFSSTVTGDAFKITIVWTVTISLLSILWLANGVKITTRVKLWISFVVDGIIIKIMRESLTGRTPVCRNTYINIFRLRVKRLSKWGVSYIFW